MAWKCPNCETLNQGKKCIVCATPRPFGAEKKGNKKRSKQNIKPLIIVAISAVIVVAAVLALALSSRETMKPVDTTTADYGETTVCDDCTTGFESESDIESPESTEKTDGGTTVPEQDSTADSESGGVDDDDNEVGIKGVSLDVTELTIKAGENAKINGSIRHKGDVDLSVKWISSDPDVVNVTASGIVIGVKAGQATVTMIASNGMSAECRITVEPSEVMYISLSVTSVNLEVGAGKSISVNFVPEDAIDCKVTWEISDESVVLITESDDSSVVVIGQTAGSATLSAKTANGKRASCKIIVTEPTVEVESIETGEKTINIQEGKEHKLNVTVLPTEAWENAKLTYTSSNEEVATVDSEGNITAKKIGFAIITVSAENGVKTSCTVNVKAEKVKGIVLSESSLTLKIGDAHTITGTTIPEGFTILWTVSDEDVINVIGGRVYAIAPGVATVYAYASDGVSATCTVTVESPVLPTDVSFESNRIELDVGQTHTFKMNFLPADSYAELTFISSNEEIATVDEKGVLTAHKEGVAAINVKTSNGLTAMCIVEIGGKAAVSSEDDFIYEFNVKGITITDYVGKSQRVVIPDKIKGSKVTAIGAGAFYGKQIIYLTLPDSVDMICEYAFANCENLVGVDLGSALCQIDAYAFAGCKNLAQISLPETLTKLGAGVFENCTSLTSIKIPDSVREIASALFKGCTSLKEITVGNLVNSIANNAFEGCPEDLVFIAPDYSMASNFASSNGFEVKNP